jgi:hypothetical protein
MTFLLSLLGSIFHALVAAVNIGLMVTSKGGNTDLVFTSGGPIPASCLSLGGAADTTATFASIATAAAVTKVSIDVIRDGKSESRQLA